LTLYPTATGSIFASDRTRLRREGSASSSCSAWQERTGARPSNPSSSASTGPLSSRRRTSTPAQAAGRGAQAGPPQARGRELDPSPSIPGRPGRSSGRTADAAVQGLEQRDARDVPRKATRRSRRRSCTTRCSGKRSGHWGKYRRNVPGADRSPKEETSTSGQLSSAMTALRTTCLTR